MDGSKNPELIPDDLAYRHFLMFVAEHANATAEEVRRRDSRLAPLHFSKQDHDFFISALAGVREKLDGIEVSRSKLANDADESKF